MQQGAGQADSAYGQAGAAAGAIDEKLAETIRQIFADNDQLRSKAESIVGQIETKRKQIAANPKLASDPVALRSFVQFVDWGPVATKPQVAPQPDSRRREYLGF